MADSAMSVGVAHEAVRDWGHLPAVAMQAMGRRCCPASRAKLRQVCRTWHDALATQFTELFVGPGNPWSSMDMGSACDPETGCAALQRSFPAVQTLHVTASSTRDYPPSYTEDWAQVMSCLPGLVNLSLQELHELEDFDNLDQSSLWDALEASLPALQGRLVGLNISDCFWNCPELFGVLRQLTGLTQLRLANNPLETACEVGIIASLSQLRVLEFGIIFDGSSQHHDVPRALEAIGDLQQLEELSLPMWRRSLGGRAHPLAPALSAALGRLTRLTSLAVDGKFGHLCVVKNLTNLRRLASCAPLSVEGWEAISKLPQLTLLTSLTPPSEPLRLNPARPHPGLDLALLATKACLEGLDVAVMQPEHVATLGQFTRLARLNLRCASTFQQPKQQAQLLTALSCLPGGLTSLTLGPLLPLSPKLLTTLARSCSDLRSLQAKFTHVAPGAAGLRARLSLMGPEGLILGSGTGIGFRALQGPGLQQFVGPDAAAAAVRLRIGDLEGLGEAGGSGSVGSGGDSPMLLDGDDLDSSGQLISMHAMEEDIVGSAAAAPASAAATASSAAAAVAGGSSTISISQALRKLKGLVSLELVLLGEDEEDQEGYGSSSSGGGAFWPSNDKMRLAEAAAGPAKPWIQLLLEDLPRGLQQLSLTGPWQLVLGAGPVRMSSSSGDNGKPQQQQQQQQHWPSCNMCGRSAAAAPAAAAAATAAADQQGGSSQQPHPQICECTDGLGVLQLSSLPAASAPMPVPAAAAAGANLVAVAASAPALFFGQQQQQVQPSSLVAELVARPAPGSNASSLLKLGRPGSGLKRPGSYSAIIGPADAAGFGVFSAAGYGDVVLAAAAAAAAAAGDEGATAAAGADVFVLEQLGGIEKRTRNYSSGGQDGSYPAQDAAVVQYSAGRQQQQQLPVLAELCLYKCHLSYDALVQLVVTAGSNLRKLQLLQLQTNPAAACSQQQQGGLGPGAVLGSPNAAARLFGGAGAAAQAVKTHKGFASGFRLSPGAAWQTPGELSTQQLQQLPVAWSTLQEWHMHPHHLWGLLQAGCFSSSSGTSAAAAVDLQLQQQQGPGALQHVGQLLNLRHLYVVNRPAAFAAAYPSVKERRVGEVVTCLPLHDRVAVQALLAQLQGGLQQLPGLRQLLLYMGHIAKERAELPDECEDVWTEAGERLLEVMPACRVKHNTPVVCAAGLESGAAAGAAAGVSGGPSDSQLDAVNDSIEQVIDYQI